MKHTKGKWEAHTIEFGEYAIFSQDTFIAQTENPMVDKEPTGSAKLANAKLIAAAPELLEQVTQLSYCFGELLNHSESIPTRLGWDREKLEEWKKELDELVNKAEGK